MQRGGLRAKMIPRWWLTMLLFCVARDGGGGEGGEGDGGAAEAPWRLPNESNV